MRFLVLLPLRNDFGNPSRWISDLEQWRCYGRLDPSMSPPPVESQVQVLTDLYNSIQNARHFPRDLLKTAIVSNALPMASPTLSLYSQQLKDIAQNFRSDAVQTALRAAQDSAKADGQNITNNVRRENRKRRSL